MKQKRKIAFGRIFLFLVLPVLLIVGGLRVIHILRIYSGDLEAEPLFK